MKKLLVSIIVIFDQLRKEKLIRLLESMKDQLSSYPTEIVLIHESNTPLPVPDLPVPTRYVTIPEKRGIPFNRNQGLQHARGEIIVFIDDDCWVQEKWLSS
ncbi:MAG: glycosyltransferase family A protein, partial [Nanoarchaeota archaeon]|nr:glycosyltransferase family A protein [Nanoarchaeota archaeon]